MLLTNRRHRLLFSALAGMDVACFLPLAMLFLARLHHFSATLSPLLAQLASANPLLIFLLFWGAMLLYLLAADLLNQRQVEFPARELMMLAIMLGATLLTLRLALFPTASLFDWGWLLVVVRALFDFDRGVGAVLFVLFVNFFLWLRVAVATDRSLAFFSVGLSFRLGMLLSFVGNALLIWVGERPATEGLTYLWIYFAFGLVAVALARIDEKAVGTTHSTGAMLPWSRFGQLLLIVGVTVGIAAQAARLYTPQNILIALGWFSPLWTLLGNVLLRILFAVLMLLSPFLEWLIRTMRGLMGNMQRQPEQAGRLGPPPTETPPVDLVQLVQNYALLRYCLVMAVVLALLALIWIFFVKRRQSVFDAEAEEAATEVAGNPFAAGLDRLRALANLLRRYGLGSQLLAAISVQNIYANVARLARRRGYPRRAALPPDEYLPLLCQAFPGQEEQLRRLTAAYMRVHYGDQPVDEAELTQLRADYILIQAMPAMTTNHAD